MKSRSISVGLSYMYEPAFNRAILPLLESGDVDALEWSFDTVSDHRSLPGWMQSLLKAFADEDRLYGHGVYYSLLRGRWGGRQETWLARLRAVQESYAFRHVSEHFGFMSSGDAHRGAPLPVPLTAAGLSLGRARLAALQAATNNPVGVENLALAFSKEEVLAQGAFLRELVEPFGGFIVLDLHNIYRQAKNFNLELRTLILSYPLERVRELHLSGGSWSPAADSGRPLRRDTHDDAVPEDLLDVLPFVLTHCPLVDAIFLERLGDTLAGPEDEAQLREEFLRIKQIVRMEASRPVPAWPFSPKPFSTAALDDEAFFREQQDLLSILGTASSAKEAKRLLLQHPTLSGSSWHAESWDPAMLDVAMQLGRKWGIELETPAHG